MARSVGTIRIKNWKRFQHYQHRNPPWIKLYRELLDPEKTPWYRGLSDNAARWLIELWLLASAHAGSVPYDSLMVLRETGRTTADKPFLNNALDELASAGAITVDGTDASAEFLATLVHRGTEVQRDRGTERQTERESRPSTTLDVVEDSAQQLRERLPPAYHDVLEGYLRAAPFPPALIQSILAEGPDTGINGAAGKSWEIVGQALLDMRAAGKSFSPVLLRAFCRKLLEKPRETVGGLTDAERMRRAAEVERRREEAAR